MHTNAAVNGQLAFSVITFTSDDAIRRLHSVCCNFYYSNQLDSAVLSAYLWTESKRNLPLLDAFSELFYAQNAFADPAGGAYSALQTPWWWVGKGLAAPPQDPTPALGPSGLETRASVLRAERSHCSYFTKRPLISPETRVHAERYAVDSIWDYLYYFLHNSSQP